MGMGFLSSIERIKVRGSGKRKERPTFATW